VAADVAADRYCCANAAFADALEDDPDPPPPLEDDPDPPPPLEDPPLVDVFCV
jgi:hypothetical protein